MKRETLKGVYQSLRNTYKYLLNAMIEIDDCIENNDEAPLFELNHINKKIMEASIAIVDLQKGYERLYHVGPEVLLEEEADE